ERPTRDLPVRRPGFAARPVVAGVRRRSGGDARRARRGRRGRGEGARVRRGEVRRPSPRARPADRPRARRPAARPRCGVPRDRRARRRPRARSDDAGRGARRRDRGGQRRRVPDRRERADGEGWLDHADRGHQAAARAGDRRAQPPAGDRAGRVRRGGPAAPGRPVRARRAHVPRDDAALGAGHPDDRAGVRLVDRRRGVHAGDERVHGVRPRPGDGVPRRAAAGEDGDQRGRRRRDPRRRGYARPRVGASRPPRRRRARRPAHRAADRRRPGLASRRPRPVAARRPAALPGRGTARVRGVGREAVGRGARRAGPGARRVAVRRAQAALRHDARVRLGLDRRLPGGGAGEQRDPVLRGVAEGRAVRPARERAVDPVAVRPEHHGVHGGLGLRARRDHQGRREADQRGVELRGPAPDADGRRVLRRRELRHVRARLRPAVRVHLAQPPHRRDGRDPARGGDVDGPAPLGRARGAGVLPGGGRRHPQGDRGRRRGPVERRVR
ncbi:MAG: Methylcrotonyl-CoA carboxylase carboxyl transferase subunit, partial [uncultured Actinomycetospora sp.]